jgi:hypothetical protein
MPGRPHRCALTDPKRFWQPSEHLGSDSGGRLEQRSGPQPPMLDRQRLSLS